MKSGVATLTAWWMATAVKAEQLRLPGKQSSGGSGRAEQFSMAGQAIFTARNSLRQDDFTARQRCRQGRAVIFGCMGSHNGMKARQTNGLESSEHSLVWSGSRSIKCCVVQFCSLRLMSVKLCGQAADSAGNIFRHGNAWLEMVVLPSLLPTKSLR